MYLPRTGIHVLCDASEAAYGSVAYLRVVNSRSGSHLLRHGPSRMAPRGQSTVPRLELCAALTGVQLARLLQTELGLPLHQGLPEPQTSAVS